MVDEELVKKINKFFHNQEATFYDQEHPEILKEENRWQVFCQKYLEHLSKPITILDVGAGTGFVSSVVARYLTSQDKIICTDISSEMLKFARRKLKNFPCQFEFINSDCEEMPFLADSTIDLITMNSVLHHLPNYQKFLKEANRLLKPRGMIWIVHEPNKKFFNNIFLASFFRLLSYFLSKLVKKNKRTPKISFERINQYLFKEKLIKSGEKLSIQQVESLVDIWSPTASVKINKEAGFDPFLIKKQYFPNFKLLALKTYNHLGKIDSSKNLFLRCLDKLFLFLFPGSGSSFLLVIKKNNNLSTNL